MDKEKTGINDARRQKRFQKNPISGTKFTIAISSAKARSKLLLKQLNGKT